MRTKILVLILAAAVVACSDPATSTSTTAPPDASGIRPADGVTPLPMGPGISVEEALADEVDDLVLVNGYLFVSQDGSALLASGLAESHPPMPAGATLPVVGLDLTEFDLVEAQGIRWTEEPVQILGLVEDGVLVHGDQASG
ncbi:MAG: hypothetical protein KatS3mg011_0327 [Acidimicrobiia bacterium]|nr:MAG: hypothetical protein KatS3mg011_0327 [Acidimicrobiia bacterium]